LIPKARAASANGFIIAGYVFALLPVKDSAAAMGRP
jgi:hypothetical protein